MVKLDVGKEGGYTVRGEQGQAGARGDRLEPVSVLTASNLDEVGVLQEKLAGGLYHGLRTALAPVCEKPQEVPGEGIAVAGPTAAPQPAGPPADTKVPVPPLQT